jgi:hypothetical protein
MAIAADGNLQPRPVGSGRQPAALFLHIHDRTSSLIISYAYWLRVIFSENRFPLFGITQLFVGA